MTKGPSSKNAKWINWDQKYWAERGNWDGIKWANQELLARTTKAMQTPEWSSHERSRHVVVSFLMVAFLGVVSRDTNKKHHPFGGPPLKQNTVANTGNLGRGVQTANPGRVCISTQAKSAPRATVMITAGRNGTSQNSVKKGPAGFSKNGL